MTDAELASLAQRFAHVGLNEQKAKEAAGNKKLSAALVKCLDASGVAEEGMPKQLGALLYNLASTNTKNSDHHLEFLAKEVGAGRLATNDQVTAAVKFFDKVGAANSYNLADYEAECGVGVVVDDAEITSTIDSVFEQHAAKIEADRYRALGFVLGQARATRLKWANALAVKNAIDAKLLAVLGPKDERDDPKLLKKAAKAAAPPAAADASTAAADGARAPTPVKGEEAKLDPEALLRSMICEGEMGKLHKAGENPQTDPKLMEEHLKATGGKVMTRFPPEPNGFLHIGHAKAINIDFGYAQMHGGHCYLRFDDTNPDAEEKRYFDTIEETVRWLGFTPYKITYSSDYFGKLYDLAVELIKCDKAYVCHSTPEEMHEQRGGANKGPRFDSPWRNRPIAESLREFERMRMGCYAEGEAVLRMKMDMTSGNPQFWDLTAYRVKYTPHYRTGSDWCIYPTYDYTHCLVDSLENITHSLCTLEFRQSRESYYWLVDALKLYKPVQWESGRLNINNTVMSKRKLNKLVTMGLVRGWDDPRMYTLVALRRRGFPASAINMFVRSTGVSTSNSVTDVARLDAYVRSVLNDTAPRLFAVLDPLLVEVENLPENHVEWLDAPNNPRDAAAGSRRIPLTRSFYIERDDFRAEKSKEFYRLAPGQAVGLLHVPFPISYVSHATDAATGVVSKVVVRYENASKEFKKPKTYIHWVANSPALGSPVVADARIYNPLFRHAFPDDVEGGWLNDVDHDSLVEGKALVEINLLEHVRKNKVTIARQGIEYSSASANVGPHREATDAQLRAVEGLKFQFARVGYFNVDPDSELSGDDPAKWRLVVNKTQGLKEDAGKTAK